MWDVIQANFNLQAYLPIYAICILQAHFEIEKFFQRVLVKNFYLQKKVKLALFSICMHI